MACWRKTTRVSCETGTAARDRSGEGLFLVWLQVRATLGCEVASVANGAEGPAGAMWTLEGKGNFIRLKVLWIAGREV